MRILALDLAESIVGWCLGEAGKDNAPSAHSFRLKEKKESTEKAVERFAVMLDARLTKNKVDLICIEGMLPAGAQKGATGGRSRQGQAMLHGAARAVAAVHKTPVRAPAPATVRVHFCGQASGAPKRPQGYVRSAKEIAEDRAATKLMVLKRARMLGYVAADCDDDNAADAAALWDFACAHWGKTAGAFALTP